MLDRPIKAIHIIGGGEYGGAENHIVQLLTSFPKNEVESKVICFYQESFAQKLGQHGINVTVIDKYNRFDPRVAVELGRILKKEQPDIIHTHGVKANFFGRLVSKKLPEAKLVTTVHSVLKHDYESTFMKFLTYMMESRSQNMTDAFICVSEEIGQYLKETGVPDSKIHVISNGIEISHFQKRVSQNEVKKEWGLSENNFVVGATARLREVKGIHLLIEAAAKICKHHSNVHFVIAGDGPERERLENMVKRLEITDNVHFLGFQQDIPRLLRGFDVFANVSLSEGLPLSVLEAMAARIPVVATAVGAVPEVITDKVHGILIEKDSVPLITKGIISIMEDQGAAKRYVENAYEKLLSSYTKEIMVKNNLEVYRSLIEE